MYWHLACTINGGHQGNSQSQGTCEHGNICTSYGNCVGKQVLNIWPAIILLSICYHGN